MRLFVARHGDSPFTGDDHARPLSALGQMQATKSAHFIKQHTASGPIQIIASDAQRTTDTAEIIRKHLSQSKLKTSHQYYGGRVGDWCEAILQNSKKQQIILVGHNPIVSMLCHYLVPSKAFHFSPACVAYIELEIATDGLKLPATLKQFYSPDAT